MYCRTGEADWYGKKKKKSNIDNKEPEKMRLQVSMCVLSVSSTRTRNNLSGYNR